MYVEARTLSMYVCMYEYFIIHNFQNLIFLTVCGGGGGRRGGGLEF